MIKGKRKRIFHSLMMLHNVTENDKEYLGGASFDEENYESGIYRKPTDQKNVFDYFFVKTNEKVDQDTYERIRKLRIPPIWNKVWVSGDPSSKIQAIGIDKKNIKQYLYHQDHIKNASEEKFVRVYGFIKALPKLEKKMDKDRVIENYYDKKKIIVTILDIIKKLHIRVGKEVYAQRNNSYGVSSLRKKHVKLKNGVMTFKFKAKSNKVVSYTLKDEKIINHIVELMKLSPEGPEGDDEKVFKYKSEADNIVGITSTDINKYIQKNMGKEFTVKDFRSYAANYHFIKSLLKETKKRSPKNNKVIKKNIKEAILGTAFHLRHTPSISKKSYVLNFAIELYQENPAYFVDASKGVISSNLINSLILDLLTMYAEKCGKKVA